MPSPAATGLREARDGAEAAIVAMGALMPEALAAWKN